MATHDITANVIPHDDDAPGRWISSGPFRDPAHSGAWQELRCHSRYVNRKLRFTVLYQDSTGTMRTEHGRDEVQGPVGALVAQASVIAAHPVPTAPVLDVEPGDILVIHGQKMRIADDRPHHYPRLVAVTE